MAGEKQSGAYLTIRLTADLKAWIEAKAARERRTLINTVNCMLEDAREAEIAETPQEARRPRSRTQAGASAGKSL